MVATISIGEEQAASYKEGIANIQQCLRICKKALVVTGAGISVSAGIPDFRSADGLYERVLQSSFGEYPEGSDRPPKNRREIKGKDFFDAAFFANPATRSIFNRFVAELKEICFKGSPTPTHIFIKQLYDQGQLLRWYTQNIDNLEKASGLKTFTGGLKCHEEIPVVALHGSLEVVSCTSCQGRESFDDELLQSFQLGKSPLCQRCVNFSNARVLSGRRAIRSGIMRPDIVLYNEAHPYGDVIAQRLGKDLMQRPGMLIVIGTSLKVVGLKKMIKDIAKSVKANSNGLVVFINKTPAANAEWKNIFDYELIGECDKWIKILGEAFTAQRAKTQTRITKIMIPRKPKDVLLLNIDKSYENVLPSETKKDVKIEHFLKKGRGGSFKVGEKESCLIEPALPTRKITD